MSTRFTITARMALLASSALLLPQAAFAEDTTDASAKDAAPAQAAPATDAQAAPAAGEPAPAGEIVVSGFRASLNKALDIKRTSVSSVDAIVAEDIAKFPDQNLAESLQRIPGISIQRDAGEGRAITVRGLGAQFTRVRVNGLETVATSSDGASSNRDRAFDFNVFASELFSSLVVHKTAEASLDEGSLGAVVDLNTGNPLAGEAGLHGVVSVVGSYNDLSKDLGPRLAGLVSWRNSAGTFGASVSAAYSNTDTFELGNNSVRWAQAKFRKVDGVSCATNNPTCDPVSLAFHPRIPRYGLVEHRRDRLGLTGSVQFSPTDATKISIDGLYSKFKEDREERWGEVLLRSNEKSIDVVDPVIDSNNNLISATLNNAYVRTEHYLRKSSTEFYQVGATWDQDVTDTLRFTALGGISKSNADIPVETTMLFDDRDANGYHYDYTDMKSPLLTFGTSVTDPSVFQLAEIRDRPSNVTNRFKTGQLRAEWDATDGITLKAGGVWRRFNFDTVGFQRDTVVCGSSGPDKVLGTITCSSSVYGFPVTSELSQLFTLGKAGQPAGNTNQWLIADLPATTAFTGLYSRVPTVDAGNTRSVQETTKGGYVQVDVKGELAGLRFAGNAGLRYINTDQISSASNGVSVSRSYDDWLPSANLALYPTDQLIIRGAIGKVMTRPSFGNLNPTGTVDGFNYTAKYGNPYLDPYRATNYDAAIEWYFAPQAVLSVAGFIKSIASFPVSGTYSATLPELGLDKTALTPSSPGYIQYDPNQIYTVSAQVNGKGATLKGVELAAQVPFSAFGVDGFLGNFGVLANATFISSHADYEVSGPAVVPNGPLVNATRSATMLYH